MLIKAQPASSHGEKEATTTRKTDKHSSPITAIRFMKVPPAKPLEELASCVPLDFMSHLGELLESTTLGAEPLLAILPQNARKANSRSNLPNNGTSKPIYGHENVGTIHNIELAHNVETIKFVNKSYIPCSNPIYASAANQLAFFCGRFDSIGR
jgi:hypothetical protein